MLLEPLTMTTEIDLVSTFMAAHAVPPEYKGRSPGLSSSCWGNAASCKSRKSSWVLWYFLWKRGSTADESLLLLSKAKEMGFKLSYPCWWNESTGEIMQLELGSNLGCRALDGSDLFRKMAEAKVIGNLLPATTSLMEDTYDQPARCWSCAAAITLTTDSNPNFCPTANLQSLVMQLLLMMRLDAVEVLNAVTINAAPLS